MTQRHTVLSVIVFLLSLSACSIPLTTSSQRVVRQPSAEDSAPRASADSITFVASSADLDELREECRRVRRQRSLTQTGAITLHAATAGLQALALTQDGQREFGVQIAAIATGAVGIGLEWLSGSLASAHEEHCRQAGL